MAGGISPLLPLITSRSSSQGWGSGGSAFVPNLPKPRSAEETALQKLEAEWLKQHKGGSLLGSVLHGSWKGISKALDFIARPSYAVAEGTRRALHGESNSFDFGKFLSGALSGLEGHSHTGFGQVLGEHNIGGKRLQGALGFALDVATDPVMLASIAAAPVTGGASLTALSERLAARGLELKTVQEAATIAEKGTKDVTEAMRARDVLDAAGDGFTARAELANKQVDLLVKESGGAKVTAADLSELHGRQALASAEARQTLPNVLAFTYKIPFSKATKGKYFENGRFVARTPIKTIGMKTIADLKIPIVSKTAENIGKAFKPGFRNESFHALERVGRATVEVREKEYIAAIGHILKPFIDPNSDRHLTQAEQLDALDWGETAKGLVKNLSDQDGHIISRVLDRQMIGKAVAEGTLSQKQGEFIDAWQKATEVLSDADYEYGRFYGPVTKSAEKDGNDVLYVPHIYTKDGRKLTEQLGSSIMTKPGFQYERLSKQPTSAKALKDLFESGEYSRLVETDPSTLLAMRARRGAQSHADSMVEKIIATTYGIPTKVADVAKQGAHAEAIAARQAKIDSLPLSTPEGLAKAAQEISDEISGKLGAKHAEALAKFDARTDQLRKEIKSIQDSMRRKKSLPSGNQLMHMSSKDFNAIFGSNPKLRSVYGVGQRLRSAYSVAQNARRSIRSLAPSETRIQKGAYFHIAPKEAREEIRANGIAPNVETGLAKGRLRVYRKLADAEKAAASKGYDVWVVNPRKATKFTTKNPPKMFTIAHGMGREDVRLYQGTTAGKIHGSKHRAALVNMLRDAKMKVPASTRTSAKPASLAAKYARAFNRDLKTLHDRLMNEPFTGKLGDNWESRLNEGMLWIERRSRQDWQEYLKDIGYKAPARNRASVLAAKKKALKAHLTKRDAVSERFYARHNVLLSRRLPKLQAKAARQAKARAIQEKKIAKHERAIAYHETSLNNPAANVPGYTKNDKIRAENGSAMKIPAEMDEAIRRIRHAVHDDQFLADFQKTWSRLMGKWKVGVTVINPGYRIRNTVSDMWNMYVSGVPLWAIGRYGARAGSLMKRIGEGDPKALRLFQEAYEHSIMSGLFGGDIERVLRTMRSGARDSRARDFAKDKKFIKAYTTLATNFNREAENWGRLTHYLYRREYEGLSPAEAARKVRTAHFDYEDLTPTERKIKGNLVPFYTWTRNNIPFQLQAMFSAPGRYSAFTKLANEAEYAAGEDGTVAPPWITNNLGFRVPFGGKGNYFLPQFGPSDLAKLQDTSQMVGLLGPFVKTPIELITNKSLLTGAPIYGSELSHPRNPVSSVAAPLLSLIPGANVGQTARVVGGQTVTGSGASPLLTYFAGQTPLTNILVNQMSNIRQAQRGRNASMLSYFGGISTYAPDQQQTLGIAAQNESEAFRQYLRGLRDEGRWPDTEQKLSAFDKKKQKLLASILQNQ